jgi:acyl-CoA thioesterase I
MKLRICFVGDSITSGQGDRMYLGWPGRVGVRAAERGEDLTVYNLGVRSDTSKHLASRWLAECSARLPAKLSCAVVFAFGINDATEQDSVFRVSLGDSLVTARSMLSEARGRWPCLWVGPTPVDESTQPARMDTGELRFKRNADLARYNAAYLTAAADLQVPYLDLFTALSRASEWCHGQELSDGMHPTAQGYERIAALFWDWPPFQEIFQRSGGR